ncbi:hypothetical protein Tco_1018393 [Tanacetum coccineum]|uniref:Uncharacterized protein n=1 Tax=Tanacetum coccineum TaxID=301880 RepID=A0ABQ5FU73_9ASTR
MPSPDDVNDKTGLNLLKLLDGEKASHEEKTPRKNSRTRELAIAQSLNADMERSLCNLRAENEDLKAKCELSSYNSMLLDLNKSKQHEVDLSNMLLKVYKEKTNLTEDLGWVLKKSIP